jgi:hypothetical protein
MSKNWTFIQSNSIDTAKIFSAAPALKNGIDLLYVDSLHTAEHVLQEVYCYFEFMNKGSAIFFDDVDCVPYMKGKRKDNPMAELANRDIHKVVRDIYYGNMDQLQLKIYYGSTGLAEIKLLRGDRS